MNNVDEILIYRVDIVTTTTKKGLLSSIKKETLSYSLVYRIDEDRFWFYKCVNGKITEDHLMKQNLSNSVMIIVGISKRFRDIYGDDVSIETFYLEESNPQLYTKLDHYSYMREEAYRYKTSSIDELLN